MHKEGIGETQDQPESSVQELVAELKAAALALLASSRASEKLALRILEVTRRDVPTGKDENLIEVVDSMKIEKFIGMVRKHFPESSSSLHSRLTCTLINEGASTIGDLRKLMIEHGRVDGKFSKASEYWRSRVNFSKASWELLRKIVEKFGI